jgi:hypothetical protein
MLSYAEHRKFRAQTQGQRPSFLSPTRREKGEQIKAFGFGPLRLGLPQCPARKWTTPGAQAQWACPKSG